MTERSISKRVVLVAAMARNRVIGRDNDIPWRVPGEQRRFKELTLGNLLLMGRRTFESIGRALPGRDTLVLSSRPDYVAPGCRVVHSLAAAIDAIEADPRPEVFIGGGEHVYRAFLPFADRVHLTVIDLCVDGDAFFPDLAEDEFAVVAEEPVAGRVPFTYFTYRRIAGGHSGVASSKPG